MEGDHPAYVSKTQASLSSKAQYSLEVIAKSYFELTKFEAKIREVNLLFPM
jgi:hypothetical protein